MRKLRFSKKSILSCVIAFLLALCFLPISFAEENKPSGKIINVVYDDSGSMVGSDNARWCQAKYAMEVFCAMMGKNDVMNIFPMSEIGDLGLTVHGNDPKRVLRIHEMNSTPGNTPFATVTEAAVHLAKESGNYDKWLIVLTDGGFQGIGSNRTLESTFMSYGDEMIKTVYLAIGEAAREIKDNTAHGVFAVKAEDGSAILEKVTSIANQIFEHQVLPQGHVEIRDSLYELDIDIPTSSLVVFAQGKNVSIGSLTTQAGSMKCTAMENVKYSDQLPLGKPKALVDKTLEGVVATFNAPDTAFSAGIFDVEIENADNVEFYYSPYVTTYCELLRDGDVVQREDTLYSGDYDVALRFVDPLTNSVVESDLLNSAACSIVIQNNGETHEITQQQGSVTLTDGSVVIDASAELPGHVMLTSTRDYKVTPEPIALALSFLGAEQGYSQVDFIREACPITLCVNNAATNKPISEEEWSNCQLAVADANGIAWSVTQGTDCGTWILTPTSADGTFTGVSSGRIPFKVSAEYQIGDQYAYGEKELSLDVEEYAGTALEISTGAPLVFDLNDLDAAQPIPVTVHMFNSRTGTYEPLNQEVWEAVSLTVSSEAKVAWNLVRGEEVSTWVLTPGYYQNDPLLTDSGDVSITLSGAGAWEQLVYSGSTTEKASINKLSKLSFLRYLAPRIAAVAFLVWLIVGYLKKKRLRIRKLNPRCCFRGKYTPKQRIRKEPLSVILPYVAERAKVSCHKTAFQCNFSDLRIQSTGKYSFKIINKSMDLKRTKICGEWIENMETLHQMNYSFGSFDISSVDKLTGRGLGKFSFN